MRLNTEDLGLQSPWQIKHVELNIDSDSIDFDVPFNTKHLSCSHCGHETQGVHGRVSKFWRYLDFFWCKVWQHADYPCAASTAYGKVDLVIVSWTSKGSGYIVLFEVLTLSMCKDRPVNQAARLLLPTHLKIASAWQMKTSLLQVDEASAHVQSVEVTKAGLRQWISCLGRSQFEAFKPLVHALKTYWHVMKAGMLQAKTNANLFVKKELLQHSKLAAYGFRNTENFIVIAYLRMFKQASLQTRPLKHTKPTASGAYSSLGVKPHLEPYSALMPMGQQHCIKRQTTQRRLRNGKILCNQMQWGRLRNARALLIIAKR